MICTFPVMHNLTGCDCLPSNVALQHPRATVYHDDSANVRLAPNSLDAIVTDPPAGIGFMGKEWDGDKGGADQWSAWLAGLMKPWFDALKPGGHALVWAIPRTSDWTMRALRLAGFEIRDQVHDIFGADVLAQNFVDGLNEEQRAAFARLLESQASPIMMQIFGTGFPKSLNVSKAIDGALGAERPVVGQAHRKTTGRIEQGSGGYAFAEDYDVTSAATAAAAAAWDGWGTALKPAVEHWILCRKPLDGTVAKNVLTHGTGGLNIDACRIGTERRINPPAGNKPGGPSYHMSVVGMPQDAEAREAVGRWPAHLVLDEVAAAMLDEQSGVTKSTGGSGPASKNWRGNGDTVGAYMAGGTGGLGDTGGASRFFYVAKAPRKEKDAGLDHLPVRSGGEATDREENSAGLSNPRAGAGRTGGARNHHPTVKSIALMRWLVRLVTPPGGVVADPFGGSGSTAVAALQEGFRVVLCEREEEYLPIILGRIAHALESPAAPTR